MPSDDSHLTSLAELAKNAALRTPPPAPSPVTVGSGLIDLHEIDRLARASTQPPSAVTLDARASSSPPPVAAPSIADVDFEAALGKRPGRGRLIAAVAGGAAALGIAVAVLFSSSSPPAEAQARTGTTQVSAAAPPATEPVHAPPAPVTPAAEPPPMPPATATAATSPAPTKHEAKGRRAPVHRAAAHGPKLMKVTSSGI